MQLIWFRLWEIGDSWALTTRRDWILDGFDSREWPRYLVQASTNNYNMLTRWQANGLINIQLFTSIHWLSSIKPSPESCSQAKPSGSCEQQTKAPNPRPILFAVQSSQQRLRMHAHRARLDPTQDKLFRLRSTHNPVKVKVRMEQD